MIKIVTVCGAGVGSSLMMRLFSQQILDAEEIEANVEASDISSVDPDSYDILITTSDFADTLRSSSVRIVRMDNMIDKPYLKEQLLETIKNLS
ncbi:PTS sugar transporter subunit IIB [Carnobacterium sp. TMP28]|uniref:PTS sugar transporter subunit IIB n=1 Tax=Carnobacterium sp. TMP28 TaxID=3397060 RepID=UPI0039DF566E